MLIIYLRILPQLSLKSDWKYVSLLLINKLHLRNKQFFHVRVGYHGYHNYLEVWGQQVQARGKHAFKVAYYNFPIHV